MRLDPLDLSENLLIFLLAFKYILHDLLLTIEDSVKESTLSLELLAHQGCLQTPLVHKLREPSQMSLEGASGLGGAQEFQQPSLGSELDHRASDLSLRREEAPNGMLVSDERCSTEASHL